MKRLLFGILLAAISSTTLAQSLACNPQAPRIDPGSGFVVAGGAEQLFARGGNSGPAWEWALDNVKGSYDWISGRSYQWTLIYSGSGAATFELRDQGALVLTLNKSSGMNGGNALHLQVSTNPSIGPSTTVSASAASINGAAVSGAISQTGNNSHAEQNLYFYSPAMSQGFTATGNVTLTYASLPTGSRVDFHVRAGNVPCNNVAPAVSITAPAAASLHQAGAPISISANATDSDGTVAQVEFLADGAVLGADASAPFSFDWTNAAAGTHTLVARARDNAGDLTTSSAVSISVNAQPTVSITSPASGTVVQAPGAITLNASAADADGTIGKVEFYQGGTLVGTGTTSPYSVSLANLAAGIYSFTAVASDDRGGTTTSSAVAVVVNAAPAANLTSPTPNAVFTAPANIPLAAQVTDSDGTISSVEFYHGATLITTLTAAPYSFTWTGVPQGTYSLTARATDNNGATVTASAVDITVNSGVKKLHFIHVDHLNTPRLITNGNQQAVWRWDQQEPFGVNVPDDNPSGLGSFEFPLRFPGQYFDKETGVHYSYFRDCYDSGTGRFCQPDPAGSAMFREMGLKNLRMINNMQSELGLGDLLYSEGPKYNHLYSYAHANPISNTDRLGLKATPDACAFVQCTFAYGFISFRNPGLTVCYYNCFGLTGLVEYHPRMPWCPPTIIPPRAAL